MIRDQNDVGKEKANEGKTKKVDFTFSALHAGSLSVAGDFNDWNPGSHLTKKDKKGVWKISLNLVPRTYQYRFYRKENRDSANSVRHGYCCGAIKEQPT